MLALFRTIGLRAAVFLAALPLAAAAAPSTVPVGKAISAPTATAVLAGGCFWGMDEVFEALRGVNNVVVGYSGGAASTAHYDVVSEGETGHAESIEIHYDPRQISYRQLLAVYFLVAHDPTQLNAQAPDSGTQYRSEIFYRTPAQKTIALETIAGLTRAHRFANPIVTQVEPLRAFYPAEEYHQHYAARNPNNPYIVSVDAPRMTALMNTFPSLLAHRR